MEAESTCPRCERRQRRRLKLGHILDLLLIMVLIIDIWVTWGHRPAPASPTAPCQGAAR